MWSRIGVKTAVATAPASVFFTAGGVRDEHSIALTGWSTSTGEPDTHLSLMLSTPDPARGRGTRLRPSHYSNPDLDRLVDRALTTIDQEAREKLYFEAIRSGFQRDAGGDPDPPPGQHLGDAQGHRLHADAVGADPGDGIHAGEVKPARLGRKRHFLPETPPLLFVGWHPPRGGCRPREIEEGPGRIPPPRPCFIPPAIPALKGVLPQTLSPARSPSPRRRRFSTSSP